MRLFQSPVPLRRGKYKQLKRWGQVSYSKVSEHGSESVLKDHTNRMPMQFNYGKLNCNLQLQNSEALCSGIKSRAVE
jgi:hypothetical protein